MERKKILEHSLHENNVIKRNRYIEHGFVPLFELCRQQWLEGIVIKRRNSKYHVGKRLENVWGRVVVYQREVGYSKKGVTWSLGVMRNGK